MEKAAADRELIEKVRSGESEAYAELIRRHHAGVQGLCASLLGDRSLAEDAAQEIFLKAYRSLDRFRGAAAFSTWLYRIASNHCLDLQRRKSREKSESLDAILERDGGDFRGLFSAEPDVAFSVEQADLVERVLEALPPDYRLVLTLRESQGLSYEEIAQTMECSLDSVKARLKRARQRLEEVLRHFLNLGGV